MKQLFILFSFLALALSSFSQDLPSGIRVYNVRNYGAIPNDGADDGAAINSALAACNTGGGGIVYVPNGVYNINITKDATYGAQILFPLNTYAASSTAKSIRLLGESSPNMYSNPISDIGTPPNTGVVFLSNMTTSGAVIGTQYGAVSWGNFNFLGAKIENITVRVHSKTGSTNIAAVSTAIDGSKLAYLQIDNVRCDNESDQTATVQPASTASGIIMPAINNFVFSSVDHSLITGFYNGITIAEHSSIDNTFIDACYNGLVVGNSYHSAHINKLCVARSVNNFVVNGDCPFSVDDVTLEDYRTAGKWFTNIYDLVENVSTSQGFIRYNRVISNVGHDNVNFYRSGSSNVSVAPIGTGLSGAAVATTAFPTSGLLAYWSFEETGTAAFVDSSGNAKTLSRVNGTTTGAAKINNGALMAAASNQYLDAGTSGLSASPGGFTIAGWFKINSTAATYQMLWQKGSGTTLEYNCYYYKTGGSINVNMYNGNTLAGTITIPFTPTGVWTYVEFTYDGTSATVSLNNGTPSTATIGTILMGGGGDLQFGNNGTTGVGLDGGMDETGIWNRKLSSGEFSYLYNSGSGRGYKQ